MFVLLSFRPGCCVVLSAFVYHSRSGLHHALAHRLDRGTESERRTDTRSGLVRRGYVRSLVVGVLTEGEVASEESSRKHTRCVRMYVQLLWGKSESSQNHGFGHTPERPPFLASPPSQSMSIITYTLHTRTGSSSSSLSLAGFFPAEERRLQLLSGRGSRHGAGASANHGVHGET